MADNPITLVLAIYGAVVSTVLAVLKFVERAEDRPRIRVTLQPGMKAFGSALPVYKDKTLVLAVVANRGRRPTTVTAVSVMTRRGSKSSYLRTTDPPGQLDITENKEANFVFDQSRLTSEYGLTPSTFVVRVDHVAGRAWSHGPLARLWKLRRLN